ncbi:MAG: histidinol-phosphate transaminase [Nitrososphaerales archaeon]
MRVRRMLEDFEPYEWETPSGDIASRLGLKVEQIVRFDTNASPTVPKKWLRELASKLEDIGINDYPDTSYLKFRRAVSRYIDIDPDRITVTNGADEGLDIIVKTFIDNGTDAVVSTPTYMFYKAVTQIAGGNIVSVPRREDFSDDEEDLLEAAKKDSTRIIFLCSPNNPTGNSTKRETAIRLLEESDVVIAVDEAYSEFSGKTLLDLTDRYDNLIILRTFSKAFSLAGARVGYMVASKKTIDLLNKIRPPNSLSVISLALAELALNDLETVRENIRFIVRERERCRSFLERLQRLMVYPSEANFLLLKFDEIDPEQVYKLLMQRGLVVRNVSRTPGLERCLRFSVRLPEQNDMLLDAISEVTGNT